ncbi:MAG: hypothetical protein CVU50_01625 [Candidatus Cloacimonetes bacterium HGW-Cloacimonetes-3]|jgi:hypothetical protein|nr:MAG: hypothetical protein CVU50_01625 [Candidatus Cloacimonetes bacterium HGW-Cloacimonetes-3]
MPKTLITDIKYLRLIKKRQLQQQIPPLALLALSFLVSFAVPLFAFHYPSLVLSFIAIIWYLYVGICYRFRERIVIPDGDLLLSPITGRVRFLKTSSDISLLKISKSPLDLIEIRSPHASSTWEEDTLRVSYQQHNLIFRFDAGHLIRFEDAPMDAGNTIGFIVGSGTVSISLPNLLHTDLKVKDICQAGLSAIIAD